MVVSKSLISQQSEGQINRSGHTLYRGREKKTSLAKSRLRKCSWIFFTHIFRGCSTIMSAPLVRFLSRKDLGLCQGTNLKGKDTVFKNEKLHVRANRRCRKLILKCDKSLCKFWERFINYPFTITDNVNRFPQCTDQFFWVDRRGGGGGVPM